MEVRDVSERRRYRAFLLNNNNNVVHLDLTFSGERNE